MNQEESEWCLLLLKSSRLETEADFDDFTKALANLRGSQDREVLRHMLRSFVDTDAGEIQFELVKACESFPTELYVKTLLEEARRLNKESPSFFRLLFQSVLNRPDLAEVVVKEMRIALPDERQFIRTWIGKLSQDFPKYGGILKRL